MPYDDKVIGGYIVRSAPVIEAPNGNDSDHEITPTEFGGQEYFVKNAQTSYSIDYNDPYEPGASGCNMTLNASASFAKQTTLTGSVSFSASMLKIITATIGGSFSIGNTLTVSNSGTKTVSGCATLKGYPRYEVKTGDLWEDDAFFDDYVSDYKAKKLESIYYEARSW